MLHIDEGQLHALLDDALDAGEADTVRQHIAACGECAVRYEEERAVRARANAILELARPLPSTIPPFETVLQRAHKSSPSRFNVPGPMRLAWAATIVLALGMGWLSRDFAPRGDLVSEGSNATDAMADAEPRNAEAPPPPPAAAPAPSVEPTARNAAAIGAVTSGAALDRAGAPAVREERVRPDASADQALKTQAQTAASNIAGQSAPPLAQQAQVRAAAESGLRRDTAQAQAARTRELAAPPAAVVAAPPPRPRWEYLDLVAAEQRVGSTIPVIPGLQVDSVAVSRDQAGYAVRVIHRLPGNGLLELRQNQLAAAINQLERNQFSSVADPAGFFSVTIVKGNLQLTGRAQLPPDSIRALLQRAR